MTDENHQDFPSHLDIIELLFSLPVVGMPCRIGPVSAVTKISERFQVIPSSDCSRCEAFVAVRAWSSNAGFWSASTARSERDPGMVHALRKAVSHRIVIDSKWRAS